MKRDKVKNAIIKALSKKEPLSIQLIKQWAKPNSFLEKKTIRKGNILRKTYADGAISHNQLELREIKSINNLISKLKIDKTVSDFGQSISMNNIVLECARKCASELLDSFWNVRIWKNHGWYYIIPKTDSGIGFFFDSNKDYFGIEENKENQCDLWKKLANDLTKRGIWTKETGDNLKELVQSLEKEVEITKTIQKQNGRQN